MDVCVSGPEMGNLVCRNTAMFASSEVLKDLQSISMTLDSIISHLSLLVP